ncbi:MAG TPA: membrane dipeptidase, partial [Sphingobacterium sp.]|nr:membrane dipeptidase [Sphingobacterium sp.]
NFYSGFLDKTYNSRVSALYRKQFSRPPAENESIWTQYEKLHSKNRHLADTPLSNLLDHIDYLVQKLGIDHVAIGSDFDGIESTPQGLEDVSKFPDLTKALWERGYSEGDIAKIMGLNLLRILKENEATK